MQKIIVDGKRIKRLLVDRETTGRDLARSIGLHEMTIYNVANGKKWSPETIDKIANGLEVDPLSLLTTEDNGS